MQKTAFFLLKILNFPWRFCKDAFYRFFHLIFLVVNKYIINDNDFIVSYKQSICFFILYDSIFHVAAIYVEKEIVRVVFSNKILFWITNMTNCLCLSCYFNVICLTFSVSFTSWRLIFFLYFADNLYKRKYVGNILARNLILLPITRKINFNLM